jgi:hypothetical protein
MAYSAQVLEVMIASPSDVVRERQIAQEVIRDWNVAHSRTFQVVLEPVVWESHGTPELGGRPQGIINKQLLAGCDILVGVFWSRIGTPTGKSIGGSVEEIEKHHANGKPTMVYFSLCSVPEDQIDPQQIEGVRAFRKQIKGMGLIQTYSTLEEFRTSFARHLASVLNENEYIRKIRLAAGLAELSDVHPTRASASAMEDQSLSPEAEQLVLAASEDHFGLITVIEHSNGMFIKSHQKTFGNGDHRVQARWKAALQELEVHELVRQQGFSGNVFEITDRGYQVADELKSSEGR